MLSRLVELQHMVLKAKDHAMEDQENFSAGFSATTIMV